MFLMKTSSNKNPPALTLTGKFDLSGWDRRILTEQV